MNAKAKPLVRHYRNGPGIDVCYGCGARGDMAFSQTMGGVTCQAAKLKLRTRKMPAAQVAWARKMAKVSIAKRREAGWL